jgi:DNA-binding PadR family transcriptional regulator
MARTLTMLGVVVLRLLCDRPMHPYEMHQRIREQGIDHIVKVTHGALYHAAESLLKAGLLVEVETEHEKRGPERTEYAITAKGRDAMLERLRELTSTLVPDYPPFRLALTFLSLLPMEESARMLEQRVLLLQGELARLGTTYDALMKRGLPRIEVIEIEHMQAHLRADLALTEELLNAIEAGQLTWPDRRDPH